MDNKKEERELKRELKIEKQKQIIDKIITKLSKDESLYYLSTMDICFEVHKIIQSGKELSHSDFELVENLSSQDIQTLISYNSSCC